MGLYDVIKEYFVHKSLDSVMEEEEKRAGDSGKSFPVQCYNLARQLIDEIRFQFDEHKTDKEFVCFFGGKNTILSRRFVFREYFISN